MGASGEYRSKSKRYWGLRPFNDCREGAIAGNSGGVRIGHEEHRLAGTDAYTARPSRTYGGCTGSLGPRPDSPIFALSVQVALS